MSYIDLAKTIYEEVKYSLGRPLTAMENDAVAQISRTVPQDPKLVKSLVARFYAKKITNAIKNKIPPATTDQFREYNMQIMNIQGDEPIRQEIKAKDPVAYELRDIHIEDFLKFGQLTGYQLCKQINPMPRLKYNYVLLDTGECYDRTDYVFKWLLNDQTKVKKTGILPVQGKLRNIKMARIGMVTISNLIGDENLLVLSKKRLGLDFEEFRQQGTILGNRIAEFFIHFRDITYLYDNTFIISPFDHIRGWFRFDHALKELSSLTLRMFDTTTLNDIRINSSNTVTFSGIQEAGVGYSDNIQGTIVNYTNPFYLYSGLLISNIPCNGGLSNQVDMTNVTFSGFTTDDPVTDAAVIAAYNTAHSIRYIYADVGNSRTFVADNKYRYHTDVSTITSASFTIPIQATFNVIAKPRVTVVMEIISEDDSEDVDI